MNSGFLLNKSCVIFKKRNSMWYKIYPSNHSTLSYFFQVQKQKDLSHGIFNFGEIFQYQISTKPIS